MTVFTATDMAGAARAPSVQFFFCSYRAYTQWVWVKKCAIVGLRSFITLTNAGWFTKSFTVLFLTKFATEAVPYCSPKLPLPCEIQMIRNSKIVMYLTQ